MSPRIANTSKRTDWAWIASILSLIAVIAVAITWWTRSSSQINHATGQADWPWIIALIGLSLGVIAAFVRIALFWCKSYFSEHPRRRDRRLMDLAQIFLWATACVGVTSVLTFFWPAHRLAVVGLALLNIWSWRLCLNLSGLRAVFTADRHKRLDEHDPLTGLYSRAAITQHLNDHLSPADRQPRPASLLFLDFDRFKLVNDSMGHEAGDDLLKQIAGRLTDAVDQPNDTTDINYLIGRLGGDEFAILVDGTEDRGVVDEVAKRLHDALTSTYTITGRTVHSSVSIGITSTEHGYTSASGMLRDCDTAMYAAKHAGRAGTAWFDTAMHEAVRDTIELENDLRHAIERNELFLVYQPIIDLESGQVTGFEALIRWRHPTRGLVGPDQFICIAEDSMLIRPIGRWVLREALAQIKQWRSRFPQLASAVMNVNLSRVQFADPGLTDYVTDTLQSLDLPVAALCLEITESTIMDDNEQALALLQHLHDLGVKLAMDDFGTGYSSLSHLHEFPLDSLKIDRAFIAHLSNNRDYAAVIHAITALAGNLGFTVVAEGIETGDQIAELQALACHKGQGYFFHKPAEPKIIEAYLSDRQDKAASA